MPGNPYIQLGTSTALSGGRENSYAMPGGVDNYGEDILGLSAGGLGLGLQAAYPVAANNAGRMADKYNQLADVAMDIGKAAGVYTDYKSGLGVLESAETMGQTVAPGNLMNAGVDTALFLGNPIGAALWGLNKMTANEENPDGKLPLISDTQKMFTDAGDWLTKTDFGQEMVKIGTGFHRNVIKPITDTTIGETFMDLARLPLTAVEAVAGVAGAGYEKLDSAVFKGNLPGGAEKGEEVDFTKMVSARAVDPLVDNVKDLFGQDKATEVSEVLGLQGDIPAEGASDHIMSTETPVEKTDKEILIDLGKDLESLKSGGSLKIPNSQGDSALSFETAFPDEHELPDIEPPVEQRQLDAKYPPVPEPDITENYEPPSRGSAEWFAETPMQMIAVKGVSTPHMMTDSGATPVQRMPEFWDWIDHKRNTLGDGGFRSYVAKTYGAKSWQYTPHFRYMNWANPSEYMRKYNGSMDYASHVHKWSPLVNAFYNEQVNAGVIVTPSATDDSANAGQQVADVAATINQANRGQTLMNALTNQAQPSWTFEQSTGPATGGNTVPSMNLTAFRN